MGPRCKGKRCKGKNIVINNKWLSVFLTKSLASFVADAIFTVSESSHFYTILCYLTYSITSLVWDFLSSELTVLTMCMLPHTSLISYFIENSAGIQQMGTDISVCCLSAFLIADDRLHINSEYTFSNYVLMCFNIHATASNYSFTLQIVYHKINIKELLLKRRSTIIAFRQILVAIIKMINSHRHSTSNIHLHLPDVVM